MSSAKYIVFVALLAAFCHHRGTLTALSPIVNVWNGIGLLTGSWLVTVLINNLIIRNIWRYLPIASENKAILITGCDTGFGRITAVALNQLGYHVFAGCLNATSETAQSLLLAAKDGKKLTILQLDVTKEQEVTAAYRKVSEMLKKHHLYLHAIINNAGINIPGMIEFAESACVTDYEAVFNVNVLGPIRICRMFLPLLRERKGVSDSETASRGRIISISSQAAQSIAYGQSAYCMSKAALSCFAEGLGLELAPFGIKSILIEPFFYKTQEANVPSFIHRIREAWNKTRPEVRKAYGVQALDECIESNQFFATSPLAVNSNINEVPELIVEAVSSPFPDVHYVKVPLLPLCLLTILRSIPYDFRFDLNKRQSVLNRFLVKYGRRGKRIEQ